MVWWPFGTSEPKSAAPEELLDPTLQKFLQKEEKKQQFLFREAGRDLPKTSASASASASASDSDFLPPEQSLREACCENCAEIQLKFNRCVAQNRSWNPLNSACADKIEEYTKCIERQKKALEMLGYSQSGVSNSERERIKFTVDDVFMRNSRLVDVGGSEKEIQVDYDKFSRDIEELAYTR